MISHDLQKIVAELESDHPLKSHSAWIARCLDREPFPRTESIPNPTTNSAVQVISAFHQIYFIAKVRDARLFEGAIYLAAINNSISLAQVVRASYENAAWLGHACHLTRSWPPAVQCESLQNLLTGTRDPSDEVQSVNIMTCINNTDKVLKQIPGDFDFGDWVRNFHAVVSEFVHPNFSSNFAELELIQGDKPQLEFSPERVSTTTKELLMYLRFSGFAHEKLSVLANERLKELLGTSGHTSS